ncbi:MAG: NAD-glutamate dehydrogenase [Acidiferrobacterales bacterium]|nr:NAD-glutamate dehydrogenase [Acidiferrobacterales bacterium]
MSILHSKQTEALIKRMTNDEVGTSTDDIPYFPDFINHYYYGVPYEDLSNRDLFDLKGAALAHINLGRKRKAEQPNIRIYVPDVERDGWRSEHAVLEVVTTDRPFLVDSISNVLSQMGLRKQLSVHPVYFAKRDKNGVLQSISSPLTASGLKGIFESFLHFEFDKPADDREFSRLRSLLLKTFDSIELAVEDWSAMRQRATDTAENIRAADGKHGDSDLTDYPEFSEWLNDGNFTFLGYCELSFGKGGSVTLDKKSVLGWLKSIDNIDQIFPIGDLASMIENPSLLVTKADAPSPIHRVDNMDLIVFPNLSAAGECTGLRLFVGLFGSTVYNGSAELIPVLRDKMKYVLRKSRFSSTTHSLRVLTNIMENYPRDMMFQISKKELFKDVADTLELQEHLRVRVLLRREQYGRFYCAIVYAPHELFNRALRVRINDILMDSLNGVSSEFLSTFSGSVLARITYTIRVEKQSVPKRTLPEIQQLAEDAAKTWNNSLYDATIKRYGENRGLRYYKKYEESFSASYQEDHSPWVAAADLAKFAGLSEKSDLAVSFYQPLNQTDGNRIRLRIYSYRTQISPSDSLPVLENMGLRVVEEKPYEIKLADGAYLWLHDYTLEDKDDKELVADEHRESFEGAFKSIWRGQAENDSFNRLVLAAKLDWWQVVVLRAYSKYLKQIGSTFSESYITETLIRHVDMTSDLIEYFEAMFSPRSSATEDQKSELLDKLHTHLDNVVSLDEDVILRGYLNAIASTLRTNHYCRDASGNRLGYLSFKIDCARIDKMPDPRPMYEIFVYSPQIEAVHLRGGKVARGGLRWSDRREDFRTEVLGLVKAQMVKNAVIVPVGSKGGFVIKQPTPSGITVQEHAIECYRNFIRGMLDITDNIVAGQIVPPANVKRYDDDDPYLVVAADKGTATFSDIANALSQEYGFWLGDAFASGGSVGYDHKGMGITARGAWESVKRHFRELGMNTQTTEFTVIGIGDMSGDVFGNGMLLSEHIRLIGAFNHIEIFIDPDPDAAVSFRERKRLFDSPGLTWKDYNKDLISEGGAIYDRSAKAVSLSPQAQQALRVKAKKLTPNELLNAMLKAPVDLLWNGGIGTYVKATTETHADTENRSNDAIRVDGSELGCKVVGEGGNLGMTQLGRVEFCLRGGRCFTDFIDNSGGVDCSDHEVNIKILLNQVVSNGDMTDKQREKILSDMTDEVAELVLTDNYQQSQALSAINAESGSLIREHWQYIRELESSGDLDPELEFLPDRDEVRRRQNEGLGLTYPELSILLDYSKMTLYQHLLDSAMPEDPYLIQELYAYFPQRLSERFSDEMHDHRLKREIIATSVTNNLINRGGPTFVYRMRQYTNAGYDDVARAFCVARDVFDMADTWQSIEDLDNKVPAHTQITMLSYVSGLLERAALWLLRYRGQSLDIEESVEYFKSDVTKLTKSLSKSLTKQYLSAMNRQVKELTDNKVPKALARRIVELIALSTAFDIVEIMKASNKSAEFVAGVYFDIGARLELIWIRQKIAMLPVENRWHNLAKSRLADDVHSHQFSIAGDVVQSAEKSDPKVAVSEWIDANSNGCRMLASIIADMKSISKVDFATLTVAISEVHLLGRSSDQ